MSSFTVILYMYLLNCCMLPCVPLLEGRHEINKTYNEEREREKKRAKDLGVILVLHRHQEKYCMAKFH